MLWSDNDQREVDIASSKSHQLLIRKSEVEKIIFEKLVREDLAMKFDQAGITHRDEAGKKLTRIIMFNHKKLLKVIHEFIEEEVTENGT